jgi:hypothetical protein
LPWTPPPTQHLRRTSDEWKISINLERIKLEQSESELLEKALEVLKTEQIEARSGGIAVPVSGRSDSSFHRY